MNIFKLHMTDKLLS